MLWLKISSAISHWPSLKGFYTCDDYWRQPPFVQPLVTMVEECRDGHARCSGRKKAYLPSMVLDVSTRRQTGRVVLRTPHHQESDDYAALSYCWGGPQQIITTKANCASHQQGIDLSHLPSTISDAVRVIEPLGIQFLWVDALCIVQDDEAAKAVELDRMGDIYAGATLVLIAGGNARSADDGFLNPWDDIAVVPICVGTGSEQDGKSVETISTVPACLAQDEISHIESRCWTFQERYLASRTLEFKGSHGVTFSCAEKTSTYTAGAGSDGADVWIHQEHNLDTRLITRGDDSSNRRDQWHTIVAAYAVRRLSFADDRLPAMAGFARTWAAAAESSAFAGEEYLAGLWSSHLVDDLMWRSGVARMSNATKFELSHYRRPGWSWVSVLDHDDSDLVKSGSFVTYNQGLRLRLGGHDDTTATVLGHTVRPANTNAPFGRVLEGTITLRAQVVALSGAASRQADSDAELRRRRLSIRAECDYYLSEEEESHLLLLRLKTGAQWNTRRGTAQRGDGGLLALPWDDEKEDVLVCRRVGCFWDWFHDEDEMPLIDWQNIEFQNVTLV
jgi:hypothetical protein